MHMKDINMKKNSQRCIPKFYTFLTTWSKQIKFLGLVNFKFFRVFGQRILHGEKANMLPV